ncbi:HCP-like protein, partial [Backusella circina FSU 941]
YLEAAKNGNRFAQNHLGEFYTTGHGGLPQNYTLAVKWYQKAAKQGHRFAQNHIGEFYKDGLGVPQNYILVMDWYPRASENGNTFAMNHIVDFYWYGLSCTPKNRHTAIEWYLKYTRQEFPIAQYNLGKIYENEEEVKDLSRGVE